MSNSLKSNTIQACLHVLNMRIAELEATERSAQESAAGDTKSSAGDKHETARELLQQERDMAARRMQEAIRQKTELERILPTSQFTQIQTGALVDCSLGTFFFSTALGFVTVDGKKIAVVSMASPIGMALNSKSVGDSISFQGKDIRILNIA
jgi:transcription elongation GreA/GreB family factor